MSPEGRVRIDGVDVQIGGMEGQPILNYICEEWLAKMTPSKGAYVLADAKVGEIDWWSKSGGVTEFLVNCLPCDAQGTFKRTDTTTW